MGVSTDAILCWGINLGEDLPWEEKAVELGYESGSDDEFLAFMFCGVEKPKEEWVEGGENENYSAYWKAKREALEEYGVELVGHCSYDYPMYILAMAASVTRASRGCPATITNLEEQPGWEERLTDACEKLGLPLDSERKWILCSMWG